MAINFDYPIQTSPDNYPAKFLGRDSTDTWNVVTYYVAANDDSINTGWAFEEVNNDGITRADVEALTPSPTPFITQVEESTTVTIAVYEDSSIIANFRNPEAFPFGEIGRLSLTYTSEAGKLISASVNSILPERE